MIELRRAAPRARTDRRWLDSRGEEAMALVGRDQAEVLVFDLA